MSSSNSIFTGSSSYSTDLQNVISRAVAIASLPLNQLNDDKTSLTKQSDELNTIDSKVAAVQSAIEDVAAAAQSSFESAVSDASTLTAHIGEGATEGTYSILVRDAGAYSTMMTTSWTDDPSSATKTYKLHVGGTGYDVTPTDNSASSVASAINKAYSDKVRATVVNVGSSTSPDYRISLQSVALTSDALDLTANGGSVEARQAAGRAAQYEVNNSGRTVESSSRTVSIASGVSFTILKSSGAPVDLTVSRSTSALTDALTQFVSAYNDVVAELDTQHGDAGGVLQGNAIISQITSALSSLATYSDSGVYSGLRDLGIELQKNGTLKQNQFAVIAADLGNSAGVTSFITGFATAAGKALDTLEDTTQGLIKTTAANLETRISDLSDRIDEKQTAIDEMQTRLEDQMATADALLASMEQQYSYISSMFSAMTAASKQYE